jgi:hypothetical protein
MPWSHRGGPLLAFAACLTILAASGAEEGARWLELTGDRELSAWAAPTDGWVTGGGTDLDPQNPKRLLARPGAGVLVNSAGKARNLLSKENLQDVEVHVEFLIAKGSNSGIKLMGLYEIQIVDSHGVKELTGDHCGGVYPRAEDKPRYHHIDKGMPPRSNAARPAGEWQTLDIVFRAPRFDAEGKKVEPARFVKVMLNDVVIHENVDVPYPTGSAWRLKKEVASGPLMLQADHGPVAFRNVRVRPWAGKGRL